MQSSKDIFSPSLELGKDGNAAIRGKFRKKEGTTTTKKVAGYQRLKVAGDDPDAKMTGYLYKVPHFYYSIHTKDAFECKLYKMGIF